MRVYERTWRSLQAQGGERTVWTLPFPSEGKLTRLAVTQVGGVIGNFFLDIYNAEVAVVNHSASSGTADPDGDDPGGVYAADPDNYRVVPTQASDSSGKLVVFFDVSEGHFVNMDSAGYTNKKRRLYLQIRTDGSDDMTFDVTLAATTDVR